MALGNPTTSPSHILWGCQNCRASYSLSHPGLQFWNKGGGQLIAICPLCRRSMQKVSIFQAVLSAPPLKLDQSRLRAVEIAVTQAIATKYGGTLPCKLNFAEGKLMVGLTISAEIPGQVRRVHLTAKDLKREFADLVEYAIEEVKYALFVLLEEGED